MEILSGLFSHMVLQRNHDGVSEADIAGDCSAGGTLTARIDQQEMILGEAAGGHFQGRLTGVPAGGPYAIELCIVDGAGRAAETLRIDDVLVGDVWLLGGQSNMEGIGLLAQAAPPDEMVRAFYMDDRWGVAQDPLHELAEAIDPVHFENWVGPRLRKTDRGTGPGVAFAQQMRRLTGVPQGVIACAHGGTTMSEWDPTLKARGGHSLYGAMLRRFAKNGGKVAGVVWYQGCSDATEEGVPHYTARMEALAQAMREDMGNPTLPVVAAQIARFHGDYLDAVTWNAIRDQQRRLPETIPSLEVVPTIDLPLDDFIHLSGEGQNRLGARLANAMYALRTGTGKPPITVRAISAIPDTLDGCYTIQVAFDHVVGALHAAGRPNGFAVAIHGTFWDRIFRVDLEGDRAILHLALSPDELPTLGIYYGAGFTPYCNITDAADRSLPAFGPLLVPSLESRVPSQV